MYFGLYGLLGNTIAHVPDLVAGGVIGFKLYMGNTFGNIPSPSTGAMLEAFEVVAAIGKHLAPRRDRHHLARRGRMAAAGRAIRSPISPRARRWSPSSRPRRHLAEWTGARTISFTFPPPMSCAARQAKARGVESTGETCRTSCFPAMTTAAGP